jgi:LYAR-type C2HC zinc finger
MVSFCCDNCQDVMTKPKVLAHFGTCRTRNVSCIDCGVTFDRHTVRAHTSCITEEAKYGPKSAVKKENSQTFCVDCDLALNGAVAAAQHYDSKKHKATLRRKKAEQRTTGGIGLRTERKDSEMQSVGDVEAPKIPTGLPEVRVEDMDPSVPAKKGALTSIKKAMKRAIRGSGNKGMRVEALQDAVEHLLADKCPVDVGTKVRKRAQMAPFRTSAQETVSILEK